MKMRQDNKMMPFYTSRLTWMPTWPDALRKRYWISPVIPPKKI